MKRILINVKVSLVICCVIVMGFCNVVYATDTTGEATVTNEPVYYEPTTTGADTQQDVIVVAPTEAYTPTEAQETGLGGTTSGSTSGSLDQIDAITDDLSFGKGINIQVQDNPVSNAITNVLSLVLSYAIPIIFGYVGLTLLCDIAAAFTGLEALFQKSQKIPLLSPDFNTLKEKKYGKYAKDRILPIAFFVAGLIIITMDLHLEIGGYFAKVIVHFIMVLFNGIKGLMGSLI